MSLVVRPRQVSIDPNGTPRVGAKLYFYESGTNTPITTYTTAAMDVEHPADGIPSNSDGYFPTVFMDADDYPTHKQVVLDADGLTVTSDDNIPTEGSTLRAELGSGTGPGSELIAIKRTAAEIAALVVPTNYSFYPGIVHRQGAVGDGVTNDSSAFETQASVSGEVRTLSHYSYLIGNNIDVSLDNVSIIGSGYGGRLLASGNNRRVFAVEGNGVSIENLYVDGQKPTVGWETSNNFDFSARVGEAASAQVEGFRASGCTMKDMGLDGIYLGNVNNALIEDCEFINCRRAGVAIVSGAYGTTNITVRNCRFFCDFDGGPSGKERPLFAIDVEPDSTNVNAENIVLENLYVHEGRLSMVGTPPITVIGGVIRSCDIVGSHGELAIDACAPEVTDINLLDGAYAIIDSTADSYPAQPFISNLRAQGRTAKINADGRANLLPRDYISTADGSLSQSGTGANSYTTLNLDGVPASVSNYTVAAGTGVSGVTLNTTVSIAADDNVWVILKVNRTDGNSNDENVFRVVLGSTIDRRYSLEQGEQWIVIAAKATGADVNPTLFFAVSGTPSADTSWRCTYATVLVNPSLVDMPSMKVGKSSLSKTFSSWAGTTLDAYNLEMCALSAGTAKNLDAILGATDQVVGLQSVGAGTITIRDTGTSGVSAGNGGIKLSGGGTATLTSATFRRHSDGYWYRV